MAVDAGRYPRRGRARGARQAKEKRQKVFLAVAAVALLVILGIQLPGLLHRLQGSSASRPATTATTTTNTGGSVSSPTRTRKLFALRLAVINTLPAMDPFIQQVANGSKPSGVEAVAPPQVRTTQFVVKDPFNQQISESGAASPPAGAATPTRHTPAAAAAGHATYLVILASVPIPEGLAAAQRLADIARSRGMKGVGVLTSGKYGSLRPGFYVVYGGKFTSLNAVSRGLDAARAHGFPSAYPRQLGG